MKSTLDFGTLARLNHTTVTKRYNYSIIMSSSTRLWWRTLSYTTTTFLFLWMPLCIRMWPLLIVKTAKIYSLLSLRCQPTLETQRTKMPQSRYSSQILFWMSGCKLCLRMKNWKWGASYPRPPSKPFSPTGKRFMASERCGCRLMLAVVKTQSVSFNRLLST